MASDLVVVRDFRHSRSDVPRDNLANDNLPLGSVGPNVASGFGDTHAMYSATNPPMNVQAWQGWPVGWDTPLWNEAILPRLVSTLYTCVDLNTRQLASFPVYGMKSLRMFKLPAWAENPEPGTYSDWTEAAKQLFNTLQLDGEAILWCVGRYKDGLAGGLGSVARWIVLNPRWVNVERKNGEVVYELGGKRLANEDVCHIKYQSTPGNLRGISPLSWIGSNIMGASAMERYSADLASNGGVPWGVLKTNRHLNSKEIDDMRARWLTASRDRSGAPAILSGDLTLDTLTINPTDMAMLETRIFDETRIAAALGVPPFLVGLPQSQGLVYANGNDLFSYHWRTTLRTLAGTVAGALSSWLLPAGSRVEFNRDGYVQASPMERAQTAQILFNLVDEKGNRAITVDEIRLAERFLPNDPTSSDLLDQMESTI